MINVVKLTVVETPSFLSDAKKLLNDDENDKANINQAERNELKKLSAMLVKQYRNKEKKL